MKIEQILQNYSGVVSMLFEIYGIQQPVNYDTLSAAITLYASDNGNPFLADLLSAIDGNNYDDYDEILGLGKKGKAKRAEKREARGGYSRLGAIARKIGIAKNRPAQASKLNKEANINTPSETPLTNEANMAEGNTQNKVTVDQVLDTVSKGAGVLGGVISAIKGGGSEDPGNGGGYDEGSGNDGGGEKKWYQKPIVLVGIGVAVVAVVGILIAVFKGGKK